MSIPEIKGMTVKERLTAMEHIWASLFHEDAAPESPDWRETVLSERKKKKDFPEAKYLTIEQLWERYR